MDENRFTTIHKEVINGIQYFIQKDNIDYAKPYRVLIQARGFKQEVYSSAYVGLCRRYLRKKKEGIV